MAGLLSMFSRKPQVPVEARERIRTYLEGRDVTFELLMGGVYAADIATATGLSFPVVQSALGRLQHIKLLNRSLVVRDYDVFVKADEQEQSNNAVAATPPVSKRIAKLVKHATTETFPLTLGSATLAELVRMGKYKYANPNIIGEHFPAPASGDGNVDAILVNFNGAVESDEAEAALNAMGLRPANFRDGAHFGIQHPERQRTNYLVCLGDSWQDSGGGPCVVVLYGSAGDRELDLYYRTSRWYDGYRFLAFRKSR